MFVQFSSVKCTKICTYYPDEDESFLYFLSDNEGYTQIELTANFETPKDGRGLFSAVVIEVDDISKKATNIFPIYYLEGKNEN